MLKNEKIEKLENMIKSIEEDTETLFSELFYLLKQTEKQIIVDPRSSTPYQAKLDEIKKRVYEYFVNNMTLHQIENEISKEFHISTDEMKNVVDMHFKILSKNMQPQKIYAALCMRKNGIKVKDIAKTLNLKPFQVSKILNKPV